jgi:hypothetical protein
MARGAALEHIGVSAISSVFRIEVLQGETNLNFAGWASVIDAD